MCELKQLLAGDLVIWGLVLEIQMGQILKPGNADGPDIFSSLYKIIFYLLVMTNVKQMQINVVNK